MTLETIRTTLGWCILINMAFYTWWVFFFCFKRDFMFRLHSRWFKVPENQFDSIHYCGLALYKIAIFIFNLVPYLALHIAG